MAHRTSSTKGYGAAVGLLLGVASLVCFLACGIFWETYEGPHLVGLRSVLTFGAAVLLLIATAWRASRESATSRRSVIGLTLGVMGIPITMALVLIWNLLLPS